MDISWTLNIGTDNFDKFQDLFVVTHRSNLASEYILGKKFNWYCICDWFVLFIF